MAERRPIYRGAGKPRRPPRAHGGGGNFSLPLWEKKFCTDACAIPWGKLCETKRLMPLYKSVVEWDDSAALEAFESAKARFCAEYHGQACDIPLPDPNLYIDMVNPDERLDPELVADLERSRRAAPRRDNAAPDGWDSFIFADKPVPVTGWGDVETCNTFGLKCSVNWDNHLEQSIDVNGKLSNVNWDCHVEHPAQTIVKQRSPKWVMKDDSQDAWGEQTNSCIANWNMKDDSQKDQTNSWGEQTNSYIANWNMKDDSQDAWKHDYGWASAAIQTDSWDNHRDSYDVPDSQSMSYGQLRRRNNDSGRRNSRNRGGPICAKPMKSKYHAGEHDDANNGWRHCQVRNDMHYSNEQAGYAKQSLAM